MKVVILVGGFGTRIKEETIFKPKPMIEIGGKPLIWHLMKYYSYFGFNEFILCLGYKKEFIINYFENNYEYKLTDKFISESKTYFSYNNIKDNWEIILFDTGINTMTGGRIKQIRSLLNETFLLTYGDTLSNVNIYSLIKLHKENNVLSTLTTVNPVSKYGIINFDKNDVLVSNFVEKPLEVNKWINAGFYVIEPEIINFIDNNETSFEKQPIQKIIELQKLAAYKHSGFWSSIETLNDKIKMEELWDSNSAPWQIWDNNLRLAL